MASMLRALKTVYSLSHVLHGRGHRYGKNMFDRAHVCLLLY